MSGSGSSRPAAGVAVLALPALVDMSWVVLVWSGAVASADAPPVGVLVIFTLVGALTLAAARPALRGHRAAAWVVVGSRVVSALLFDLPAYVLGAPVLIDVIVSVVILLTVLGIWWASPLLSQAGATRAATRAAV
jgi:hypothetical protein